MMTKPSLPQGTRDFGPDTVRKREFIFRTIREVFGLYGFQPLETPAMENLDTLLGKYGEEGNKLIFKILNNGLENPAKQEKARTEFEKILAGKNSEAITERALKYDLTIPFARYVAMQHRELVFPFRRYQVQPVWRADRPARGRYREFYQCDADVVGSNSLLNEIEPAQIYIEVFDRLGLNKSKLKLNHRKILAALAETCGGADQLTEITVSIDKLEKTGREKVIAELRQKGLKDPAISRIEKYLSLNGNNREILEGLEQLLGTTESGKQGIADLRYLLSGLEKYATRIDVDPTLARGLNYYTGTIFEARAPEEVKIGSIGGGGRYDDLTGLFGVPGIPGVGISFGVDRIYDVLEELNLFPPDLAIGTRVLFFNLGDAESKKAMEWAQALRGKGIASEVYPETLKFDKQFKYAEKKNIPYVVIIGEKELQENRCNIKELASGEQQSLGLPELLAFSFR